MKTYIQYGTTIKSKDLMEAISIPSGVGPISGFGSVNTDVFTGDKPNALTVNPGPFSTSIEAVQNTINDRLVYHGVNALDSEVDTSKLISEPVGQSKVNFSCITKDGYEYANTNVSISVPIIDSQRGNFNEIMVFAYHDYINVNIENPVYFKAFWNRGSTSFYDFYRNIYTDMVFSDFKGYTPQHTYQELVSKAESSRGGVLNDNGVLIGIYGVNPNNPLEYFSLVPYGGSIQALDFDKSIIDYFDAYLAKIKSFMGEYPANTNSIKEYVDGIMTKNDDEAEPVGYIPIGGIILWSKPEVPTGYAICDGSNGTPDLRGRFVYGYGATDEKGNALALGAKGGSKSVKLNVGNLPEHTHGIPRRKWKAGDNANNRNMVETDSGFTYDIQTGPAGKADPDPISTVPPYIVMYYIMRVR